ncbi:autotransporter outer membrane beta-barrel domain-containing protein [Bartonella tribocorum]|uniref:Inducible Bartonella autotransporter E protein n=1 Tax=Bartonella tribocorum (strain DSM 28219 / CCUG 45778 / CIP 105476 / IBS 506) TaxID=382640 RepID=A9IWK6_BART1|nr:autotransporter outer membrane beta-barrel domain-containing protein [Bartonella tribocorum]CAK01991.1 inducible Bartonella autotransporter E protein [Bartonella tribocorum CIP 105476]CDO49251.1 inducible autotransporter E [Bartonella tribocorum]
MKKSFLLYTVSGVLFYSSTSLSYALRSVTPPTMDSSSSRPVHAECPTNTSGVFNPYNDLCDGMGERRPSHPPHSSSEANVPTPSTAPSSSRLTTGNTTSSPSQKPDHAQETEGVQSHTTTTQNTPITQSSPTEMASTTGTAPTTEMEVKSRRRSGVSTSSTDSSSEKTSSNSAISLQSEATQSSPNLQSTSANSESTGSILTRPTTGQSPAPQESELTQSISVKPAPVQSASTQEVSEKSKPTKPVSEKTTTKLLSTPKESETRQRILLRPEADTQKVSKNSEPQKPESTRPTVEQSSTSNVSELSAISVRPAAGKLTSQETSESLKPAPVQPISPIKQSEKPAQIENISAGVEIQNGKTVTLHNKKIQDRGFAVHADGNNSKILMNGGTVDAGFVALSVSNGGEIDATDITVTSETTGLANIEGTINLKDSSVHVTGNYEANGIIFRNNPYRAPQKRYTRNAERNTNAVKKQEIAGKVNLENTNLFVDHGVGINLYGRNTNGVVSLKNSKIHADVLLKNIKNENESTNTLTLVTDHSSLEGQVKTSKDNRTIFDLKEETKWLLKPNKNAVNNDRVSDDDNILDDYRQFGLDEESFSNLSVLHLTDSAIVFDKPVEGLYQTLLIGPNLSQGNKTAPTAAVYSATGVAEIYVNTQWDKHSPITEQKTDRVVINGDVLGSTVVHITLQETDKKMTDNSAVWGEHMASLPLGTHGISIIQVSGQANENSFTLAGNYMTIGGQPYKYVLKGYKPGTSHESQSLLGNDSNFWDFRLQNAYIDNDKKVRALLPQVANYLTLPNALFSAGFADVNNQNTLLDAMRSTVFGANDNKKNNLFFSSYGEKVTLSSSRGPLHYGYDADVNYGALQLGIILAALESNDISTHFGLLGTYGKLAFTPKEMQDSEKTMLDKWSLTAYSGVQHSNGLYVNALLSYGTLKGNITTALVGNAAKLDGTEILNISATLGQKLATDTKGLVFEPQVQFIYQNLMFDILSDANGLKVDMENPHQWLIRFGGRLTKTIMATEENKAVSFYGKMNVIRTFGDGKTIKIADTFHLDPTGSSIEGGIGVNAYLSQSIVLNGDISYRQKLQKAGVTGTNVSGGIRYRF